MFWIYVKKYEKSDFMERICAAVTNESLERIEILSEQNTESVHLGTLKCNQM